MGKTQVKIVYDQELDGYNIESVSGEEVILDGATTEAEARRICRENGWEVVEIVKESKQ